MLWIVVVVSIVGLGSLVYFFGRGNSKSPFGRWRY